MMLGRWKFFDRQVYADVWIPRAGLSEIDLSAGCLWIRLDGIPVHLRSTSLFRALGEVCGSFLDHQETGCSWNSVRLRIKPSGPLPSRIPVDFKGELFQVRVVVESQHLLPAWRDSNSTIFVRASDVRVGLRARAVDAGTSVSPTMLLSADGGSDLLGNKTDCDKANRQEDDTLSLELAQQKADGRLAPILESSSEVTAEELPRDDPHPHALDISGQAVGEIGVPIPTCAPGVINIGSVELLDNGTQLVDLSNGPPSPGGPLPTHTSSPPSGGPFLEAARKGLSAHRVDCVLSTASDGLDSSAPTVLVESFLPSPITMVVDSPISRPDNEERGDDSSGDEEVRETCSVVAERLEILLEGSLEDATCFIRKTADTVLSNRNTAKSKSKLERELRKIDIDGDFSSKGDRRSRRDREVGSHLSLIYDC
ncbi:hypothetical protein LINGRAHAP2_LOCUS8892 [Linum grandiflorum]